MPGGVAVRGPDDVLDPSGSAVMFRLLLPLPLPEAGIPAAARSWVIWSVTRRARTAPSTETPMVPPSDRKNATLALAAPMSLSATVFCTARTRFCMVMPTPVPTMNMAAPTRTSDVSWSMVPSSANPATRMIEPATMYGLILPDLVISRPATIEDPRTPAIIGMVSRPASVGL
ncbi:hypothetical protein GCM10027614_82100 [Micromonospora vulcania]